MRHNHRAAFWAALYASGALVLTTQGTPIYAHEKELLGLPVILEHQLVAPEPFLLQPSFSGCTVQVFLPVNPDFEQQVVELVNDHRHSVNRPPLKRVTLLDEAARYHARDMREDDYFSHDTRDRVNGVPEFVCSWHTRIGSHYPGWSSIGENIAAGHSSPHSVMNAWLSSTYHRNNIESTNFREIGVGFDELGGAYGRYWVQNFGQRFDVYPLVINREYSRTASPNVTVYIYGTWSQMRLRNDGGVWSAWQPFTNTLNWTLNWVQGVREVCAEFTNGSQTFNACDTILLTTSAPDLTATPATLSFLYDLSMNQPYPRPPVDIQLSNTGNTDVLTWSVSTSHPWISVSPASGTTPSTAQIELVPSALPTTPGIYQGIATFSASGTSAPVTVTLQVVNLTYRAHLPIAIAQP